MTWYIAIGDDLLRDQTIKFPFFRTIGTNFTSEDLQFTAVLFECEDMYGQLLKKFYNVLIYV